MLGSTVFVGISETVKRPGIVTGVNANGTCDVTVFLTRNDGAAGLLSIDDVRKGSKQFVSCHKGDGAGQFATELKAKKEAKETPKKKEEPTPEVVENKEVKEDKPAKKKGKK